MCCQAVYLIYSYLKDRIKKVSIVSTNSWQESEEAYFPKRRSVTSGKALRHEQIQLDLLI